MAFIKLIKSGSYSDGTISVNRKRPVVMVPDEDVQHYLRTGFFATTEVVTGTEHEEPEPESETELPYEVDEEELTAEERRIADLENKSVKELRAFAERNGIDLADATKKDAIISTIIAADRKAAEAREALRQE